MTNKWCTEWGKDGVCRPRLMHPGEHLEYGAGRAIRDRLTASAWALIRNDAAGVDHPDVGELRKRVERGFGAGTVSLRATQGA